MKTRNLVATVTSVERDEIEVLFERQKSLHSLSLTLASNNDLFQEKSHFAEKIGFDLLEAQKGIEHWWDKTAMQYNLNRDQMNCYQIDFSDGNLYYNQE